MGHSDESRGPQGSRVGFLVRDARVLRCHRSYTSLAGWREPMMTSRRLQVAPLDLFLSSAQGSRRSLEHLLQYDAVPRPLLRYSPSFPRSLLLLLTHALATLLGSLPTWSARYRRLDQSMPLEQFVQLHRSCYYRRAESSNTRARRDTRRSCLGSSFAQTLYNPSPVLSPSIHVVGESCAGPAADATARALHSVASTRSVSVIRGRKDVIGGRLRPRVPQCHEQVCAYETHFLFLHSCRPFIRLVLSLSLAALQDPSRSAIGRSSLISVCCW